MLGEKYKITKTIDHTKDRILLESARLFALSGYHAVSMRDIAKAVNIQSGSIYNHYSSKQGILDAILDKCIELYLIYYDRLDRANEKVESIEEMIHNMFYELREVNSLFTYYGFAVANNLKFENEKARKLSYDTIFLEGKKRIKNNFDQGIEKGMIHPFSTEVITDIIMNTAMIGIELRLGEAEGVYFELEIEQKYAILETFLIQAAKAGI